MERENNRKTVKLEKGSDISPKLIIRHHPVQSFRQTWEHSLTAWNLKIPENQHKVEDEIGKGSADPEAVQKQENLISFIAQMYAIHYLNKILIKYGVGGVFSVILEQDNLISLFNFPQYLPFPPTHSHVNFTTGETKRKLF